MNRFRSLIAKWRCTLAHRLWPTVFNDLSEAHEDLKYARTRQRDLDGKLREARSALSGHNPDAAKLGGPAPARFLGVTRYPGGTVREDALTFQEVSVAGTGLTVSLLPGDGISIRDRAGKALVAMKVADGKTTLTLP
ncbi:hypothetical protein [Novosphingobium meiothermophilum]|uniref:hypothetical protein n=1 Tax=Novosphingobium meiothermophilum TaxID=2202251 RepID=UPI000D6DD58E|nr:hypothetical protein [Novosphingobium meiothermophilum]